MFLKRFVSFLLFILIFSFYVYQKEYKKSLIEKNKVEETLVNYEFNNGYNELICKNILIIDKINLKKCMNDNDVDKDIAILFDDKTVVLASHSGNASNAYFKNLYKLETNDEVIFYHNQARNTYYVKKIDTKKKKDKLKFENIENQLILVTCSYAKKDEQIVFFLQK